MAGFDPAWLAARRPFDEAALDRPAIDALRAWGAAHRPALLRLVDLGSGTGAALERAGRWLCGRPLEGYAVERDAAVLEAFARPSGGRWLALSLLHGDLLSPLAPLGGPADGTVDLVLGHAIADLLPLDRLAGRVAALLRPGGLAHLALTYDGETCFSPTDDPLLEARVMVAYHRHMDRGREAMPSHGGSQAGRRVGAALRAAGLEIVREAPSVWEVRADGEHGREGELVLEGMIGFVVDSLLELGGLTAKEARHWLASRRRLLEQGRLRVRVRHRDVLARRPG